MKSFAPLGRFAGVLAIVGSSCFAAETSATRPNIIFVLVDDMGWTDLGCMGSTFYETPNIDRLASQGMRFTQAYSACTVCSPTRAAVMTGKYPARLHITDWIPGHARPHARLKVPDWTMFLPLEEMNIARALKSTGYATASIGKWHLGGEKFYPDKQGFDLNIGGTDKGLPSSYFAPYRIPTLSEGPSGEFLSDRLTTEALTFIEQKKDRPFFIYLPHYAVHVPLMAKPDVVEKYKKKVQPGAPHCNPVYAGLVESVDDSVGRILRKLDELKLSENTIILFTSDNGGLLRSTSNTPLRAGKGSAYEGGVRVPLIVKWPGVTRSGTVSDTPVISVDYLPTMLAMAGVKEESRHVVDGESLVPLLKQSGSLRRDTLYWHYPHYHPGGATPYSAIRQGDFRLIEFFEDDHVELYNLKEDIGEKDDLAAKMTEKVRELRSKLAAWRKEIGAQLPAPNPDYDPARTDTRPARAERRKKPNVLFIAIDDLRDWVGYLGKNTQVKTPNLDRLAARGVRFTHSYCAAPVCNASRAALLSGLRPSVTGVYENSVDWRRVIPADKTTLPLHFKNNGYYVAGAGKIYHEAYRRDSDWNEYLRANGADEDSLFEPGRGRTRGGQKGVTSDAPNDGVGGIKFKPLNCDDEDMLDYQFVSYVLKRLNQPHDKPFFLACGLRKPHMPWDVPKKYYAMYPLDEIVLPKVLENDLDDVPPAGVEMAKPQGDHAAILKSGRWKQAVQGYLAAITFTDAMVGRLIDGFDKSSYKDNTLIVLWSDHGWNLGEKQHWRKFALWEEATRSPLIWVVPGLTKQNSVCDRSVDFMHIYPTLCDLCGLPMPSHVEGRSIRPLLKDPAASWDTPALITYKFDNHAIRSEGWRYIRYDNGGEELYDETKDPYEWTNLAKLSQYDAVKAELAKALPKSNAPWPERATKSARKAARQAMREGQGVKP